MLRDLGNCEWFVWDIRQTNLIDSDRLDGVVTAFLSRTPDAQPRDLATHLVGLNLLTELQAETLLRGKSDGLVLGPFTLTDVLGAGSLGTVYKARSRDDGRLYAVKVLPRRSMWNVRLALRKVKLFEQCRHPAIVPFTDVGTAGGWHYLVWPFAEGVPLDALVREKGRLPAAHALRIALQVAEALDDAHQAGLFHGLLKPANLLVGTDDRIKVLDFGLGCLLVEAADESLVDTMSMANAINSALDCASPESVLEPTNLNSAGDQYSLGCVLYFCLTGRYPFPEGTAVDKMVAHQTRQPPPVKTLVPNLPDGLAQVVERLMEKKPGARFPTPAALLAALRPLMGPTATAPALAVPSARTPEGGVLGPGPTPLAEVPVQRTEEVVPILQPQGTVWPQKSPTARQQGAASARSATRQAGWGKGNRYWIVAGGLSLAVVLTCACYWWFFHRGQGGSPTNDRDKQIERRR